MKPASLQGPLAVFIGAIATVLVAAPAAFAVDLVFVFDGVIGTFRSLEAGTVNGFPPAEVEMNFVSSAGSPKGRYDKAPRCLLPDCGYLSVTADGSIFTSPALFHGHNGGWQLLITSSPPTARSTSEWTLFGSLLYCPGYEVDGDPEKCPAPGPGNESRAGWLTPPPRADPGEPVPGPLPLLGAAAAFGFSRKLRTRIRKTSQR
ncbi:hypothetical protein KQ305_00035 [Synechococcus sp. CS-1332]|nr:hypothetical protein [Synechococcus sp. CS-1332]